MMFPRFIPLALAAWLCSVVVVQPARPPNIVLLVADDLAYNAVHSPMQATQRDLARFAHISDIHRRIFAAMLASLDDGVGALDRHPESLSCVALDQGLK